jgi:hypothetical protein
MAKRACWFCGHLHAERDSYGCEAPVSLGIHTTTCGCPLKESWAQDQTKVHRVGLSRLWSEAGQKYTWWPRCPCGWEGYSYWRRPPAEAERDDHIAEIIAAGGQANDRKRQVA